MKINFNEIEAFIKFYSQIKNESFSFQTAYKLSKLYNILNEEVKFFTEKMQLIIDTYAQKDNDGNYVYGEGGDSILIIEEKLDECSNKLNELQAVEIDIDNIEFDISEFNDVKLSPQMINAIMKFIKKETL